MNDETRTLRSLQTLAGVAGALVGPLVLTFAIVGDSIGVAFVPEVVRGGSVRPWMDSVRAAPLLSRLLVISLTLGFGAMFVSAFAWFHLLERGRWPKYVSLCGYLVGVPLAITTFAQNYTLMRHLVVAPESELAGLEVQAALTQHRWLVVSGQFGPFLVVVLGTGMLAWSALREARLPAWVCYAGLACAAMAFLQLFQGLVPALAVFSVGAGPFNMAWFSVMGIALLLRRERPV